MAIYSDLNAFTPTDKSLVEDLEAIYQSLSILFATNKGERLFNLDVGVDLDLQLFELMDDLAVESALNSIINAVSTYEPRVIVDYGKTAINRFPDENRMELQLIFSLEGFEGQQFLFKENL